ncbi:hypothetical protein [Aquirhabdus sp.]|uniref:hypothetical protein n=1 Tax=Aquirhabdus sp. TaxID=2824160 RepID=UPI00396CF96D
MRTNSNLSRSLQSELTLDDLKALMGDRSTVQGDNGGYGRRENMLNHDAYVAHNLFNNNDPSGLRLLGLDGVANKKSSVYPIDTQTIRVPALPHSPDPESLLAATYQRGLTLSGIGAMGLGIGGNVGAGIANDDQGNYSLYGSYGGGLATGTPALEAGVQAAVSNGRTVRDLSGKSYNVSVGGGLGPHATLDGFTGKTDDNRTVIGGGVSVGPGFGGGSVTGKSNTYVSPSINIRDIIDYFKRK